MLGLAIDVDRRGSRVQAPHRGASSAQSRAGPVKLEGRREEFGLALFETIPLPTMVFDADSLEFLAVNQAASDYYGYALGDFLRMTVREIRPADEVGAAVKLIQSLPQGLYPPIRAVHRKRDGNILQVEIASRSLVLGRRRARVAIVSDATALRERACLREASEKLRRVDALREDLVRRIASFAIPEMGEVERLIGAAARGLRGASDDLRRALDSLPPQPPSPPPDLSARELQVLALLAHGLTNQQVGDRLALSVKTVEKHRSRLMAKLKLVGRADLVRYALHRGLLVREP